MFAFDQLQKVQIEITNRCQASCPMCPRNIHGGIENPLLKLNDWSFEDFVEIFNAEVLKKINTIIFCGDFGDPVLNNDLPKMCRYIKEINENIFVSIHTNGSLRTPQWWEELVSNLPQNHEVNFALDGLADTHSTYRIGTDYNKIINNATAFINAGGNATWVFIKFKHNQHQLEEAEHLSKQIGFKNFKPKNSKRFGKQFPVLDRKGNLLYNIEQNSQTNISQVNYIDLVDYKTWKRAEDVDCFADMTKELYIDAHYHLMPCCMIASFLYTNYEKSLHEQYNLVDDKSIIDIGKSVQTEIFLMIEELGGIKNLDARIHGIKNIMNSEAWQSLVKSKWSQRSSSACIILCSKDSPYIKTEEQWIESN